MEQWLLSKAASVVAAGSLDERMLPWMKTMPAMRNPSSSRRITNPPPPADPTPSGHGRFLRTVTLPILRLPLSRPAVRPDRLSAPAPVPEKVGISTIEEGDGSLNNEPDLPALAPAISAGVSLPENGQDQRAEAVESHTSVLDDEKAEVIEAAVSVADAKQNTGGDAGDVGMTVSDGKQQTAQEPRGGGDVTSQENGQEPGSEAVEMHIESDVLLFDEKHNSAGNATVHGADLSKQIVPESVTDGGGRREQFWYF